MVVMWAKNFLVRQSCCPSVLPEPVLMSRTGVAGVARTRYDAFPRNRVVPTPASSRHALRDRSEAGSSTAFPEEACTGQIIDLYGLAPPVPLACHPVPNQLVRSRRMWPGRGKASPVPNWADPPVLGSVGGCDQAAERHRELSPT